MEQHNHTHTHPHPHTHTHSHQHTKAVTNRIARAVGHMQSVKRMVEDGKDCSEILIQLSAIRSAVNAIGRIVLQDHIKNCLVDAIENDDHEVLDNLNDAIDKFLK